MSCFSGITDSMNMNLSKLWEMVDDRGAWCAAVQGVAKNWSFNFSIIPSKEIPGLIFGMDWLDLLVVQGTLKSLLQHHSSETSILQHSAFFTVHLSHDHRKNHSLD